MPFENPNPRPTMRYADYLKRSIDRLTTAAWEQLLTTDPPSPPTSKTVLTTCPCCRGSVVVELAVSLRPRLLANDPKDASRPGVSDDTQIDLAVLAPAGLVTA